MAILPPTDLPSAIALISSGAAPIQVGLRAIEANASAWGFSAEQLAEIKFLHHQLFHVAERGEAILRAPAGSLSNPQPDDGQPKGCC